MHGAHTASHRHFSERSHSNARARTSAGTRTPARTHNRERRPYFYSGRGSQSLGGKRIPRVYRSRPLTRQNYRDRAGSRRRRWPVLFEHVGTPTADGEDILGRRKTCVPKISKPSLQYYIIYDSSAAFVVAPPSKKRDICISYRRRACDMYVKVTASATQFKSTQYLAAA